MKILLAHRSALAMALGLLGYLVVIASGLFFCLLPGGALYWALNQMGLGLSQSTMWALAMPFWLPFAWTLGKEMMSRSYRHVVLYQEILFIRRFGRPVHIPLADLQEFSMDVNGVRMVGPSASLRLKNVELLPGTSERLTMLAHCCQADRLARRLDAGETLHFPQSWQHRLEDHPLAPLALGLILSASGWAAGLPWLIPVVWLGLFAYLYWQSRMSRRGWGIALHANGLKPFSDASEFLPWSDIQARHYDGMTLVVKFPEQELRLRDRSGALLGLTRLLQWRAETSQLDGGSRRNKKVQEESSSRSS